MLCFQIKLAEIVREGATLPDIGGRDRKPAMAVINRLMHYGKVKKRHPKTGGQSDYRLYFSEFNGREFVFYEPSTMAFVGNVEKSTLLSFVEKEMAFYSDAIIAHEEGWPVNELDLSPEEDADPEMVAKAFGCRALTGTPKQKEWAVRIMAEKLRRMGIEDATFSAAHKNAKSAKFWIEHRDLSGKAIAAILRSE